MIWIVALCALGLTGGFLLIRRVPICPRTCQTDRIAVSVIIPARNEERNLPRLLDSIRRSECQPEEVIVVDDGSSDRTAEVAISRGARVLTSRPLPDGWTGKTWACHQGANEAIADVLLFLDADTYFEAEGFDSMVAFFLRQHDLHTALSLLPFHVMKRRYEGLSLFFNLLMAIGAGGFRSIGSPRLFGQSLLIRRETYENSGGHESVRGNVLENFALSSQIRSMGGKSVCLGGQGTLNVRMYPEGFWQLCQGWTKAFADGAAGSEPVVLIVAVIWIAAIFATFLSLPIAPRTSLSFYAALYLFGALQITWFARQIGNYSRLSCVLYPISLIFYFAVFGQSLYRRTFRRHVIWRGRRV